MKCVQCGSNIGDEVEFCSCGKRVPGFEKNAQLHIGAREREINPAPPPPIGILINCPVCNKTVADIAEQCVHCGAPIAARFHAPWYQRTSVALCFLAGILVVSIGFVHIIKGSKLPHPDLVWKQSFGFSETVVDVDVITSMPYIAATSKYPLGVKALQEHGYIEKFDDFQSRVQRDVNEEMKKRQAEIENDLRKLMGQ